MRTCKATATCMEQGGAQSENRKGSEGKGARKVAGAHGLQRPENRKGRKASSIQRESEGIRRQEEGGRESEGVRRQGC
ncbi:hypothetical protein L7F22_060676 [Adiantum nelumboides]|nr:hypothetical protein [Adiantum nelumboides]